MAPPPPKKAPPSGLRKLDFRAEDDDAWYSVGLRMERGNVLRVMYVNFYEQFDKRVPSDSFRTPSEVEAFAARFRPSSDQLQDTQCRLAGAGATVCVAHAFGERDKRFYDAIVKHVSPSKHIFKEGEEICTCKFEILWIHGPLAGHRTTTGIENLCLIQPRCLKVDPVLDHFLDIASKKLRVRSSQMDPSKSEQASRQEKQARDANAPINKVPIICSETSQPVLDSQSKKSSDPICIYEEVMTGNLDNIMQNRSTGRALKRSRKQAEDITLGGELTLENDDPREIYYFIRIENVENDLSPFTMMEFIKKITSVSTQAVLCPGNSEFYARATICMETKEDAERLYDFLHNPEIMILSSSGRPWIVNEKWSGSVYGSITKYEKVAHRKHEEHSTRLKLVHKGTEEFEKGKKLVELHMQYHEHVENLRKKLVSMERELLEK